MANLWVWGSRFSLNRPSIHCAPPSCAKQLYCVPVCVVFCVTTFKYWFAAEQGNLRLEFVVDSMYSILYQATLAANVMVTEV